MSKGPAVSSYIVSPCDCSAMPLHCPYVVTWSAMSDVLSWRMEHLRIRFVGCPLALPTCESCIHSSAPKSLKSVCNNGIITSSTSLEITVWVRDWGMWHIGVCFIYRVGGGSSWHQFRAQTEAKATAKAKVSKSIKAHILQGGPLVPNARQGLTSASNLTQQ